MRRWSIRVSLDTGGIIGSGSGTSVWTGEFSNNLLSLACSALFLRFDMGVLAGDGTGLSSSMTNESWLAFRRLCMQNNGLESWRRGDDLFGLGGVSAFEAAG